MADEIPDLCEPVIGVRYWRVWPDPLVLVSGNENTTIGSQVRWPPHQRLEAVHGRYYRYMIVGAASDAHWMRIDAAQLARERCAGPPCEVHLPLHVPGCGIYAFRDAPDLMASLTAATRLPPCVVGAVALWGRVAIHELGYRGQFAYPKAFYAGTPGVAVAALALTYGVPYQEDPVWKSALSNDASFPSPSSPPSLRVPLSPQTWVFLSSHVPLTASAPPPPPPSPPPPSGLSLRMLRSWQVVIDPKSKGTP